MKARTLTLALWLLLAAIALSLSGLALTGHLLPGDRYILRHLQRTPAGGQIEDVADALHAMQWAAVGIAIALALVKRRLGLAITGVLVLLALPLNVALKEAIERARPDVALIREHAGGFGFPSGHAMSSMLLYGYSAVVIATIWPRAALFAATLAAATLLLIGFDRVYNAAHWPSDVFGGWAWGGLLLFAALAIGDWLAAMAARRSGAEARESATADARRR